MSVQPITRQDILKKVGELVQNLPDDKLQQAWEQVEFWGSALTDLANRKGSANSTDDEEILEFTVPQPSNTKPRLLRTPLRLSRPRASVQMETTDDLQSSSCFADKLQKNVEWWNQNYEKIVSDSSMHSKYVAISNGYVFTGDSYFDAFEKTQEQSSKDTPYIFFLNKPAQSKSYAN